jgi:hypothetical protein
MAYRVNPIIVKKDADRVLYPWGGKFINLVGTDAEELIPANRARPGFKQIHKGATQDQLKAIYNMTKNQRTPLVIEVEDPKK